jgi:glycosyltransferase involved in cell wall biosynthesis
MAFKVSLVATVRNERCSIDSWLAGICEQSRIPDELIVVDGGSDDGTWEILESWSFPCNVVIRQANGASISAGRNLALSLATGDIVAITDAGTVADRHWLSRLVSAFDDANVDVASGFFVPDVHSVWEKSLAAATLPDVSEVRGSSFLPSSRSVAVRSAWTQQGFVYPEWLDYCEDLIWDLQLRNGGARFKFVPNALVEFAVRPGPVAFMKQYFRYARGDGKAGLFGKRHLIRYTTYLVAVTVLVRKQPAELAATALLGTIYLSKPMSRLVGRIVADETSLAECVLALGLLPLQVGMGDLAKMAGYPAGVYWRWKHFKTLHPQKNWRRITPEGAFLDSSTLPEGSQPRPD